MSSVLSRVADFLDPLPVEPIREWIQTRLKEHVWKKQVEICESVERNRFTAVQ